MIIMECGHSPNAKNASTGSQACAICNCESVKVEPIELTRPIKCFYCKAEYKTGHFIVPPFFQHNADREYDNFVCGCRGWD